MGAAAAPAAITAGGQLLGGLLNNRQQSKAQKQAGQGIAYDPTNPILRPLIGQQAQWGANLFNSNGASAPTSPLQQGTGNAILQYLNQMSPEMRGEGVNPGQAVIDAARPQFDRNLQHANTQLANNIPGRFSSAFVSQGNDLSSRALQDFNLFQQQALQSGQEMQSQRANAFQNFLVGAAGQGNAATGNLYGLLGQLLGWSQPSDQNVVMGANKISGVQGGGYGGDMISPPGTLSPTMGGGPMVNRIAAGPNALGAIMKRRRG